MAIINTGGITRSDQTFQGTKEFHNAPIEGFSSYSGAKIHVGFVASRMAEVDRDLLSAADGLEKGLIIINTTTNKLNFYNGSSWEAVTSA